MFLISRSGNYRCVRSPPLPLVFFFFRLFLSLSSCLVRFLFLFFFSFFPFFLYFFFAGALLILLRAAVVPSVPWTEMNINEPLSQRSRNGKI